jgi:hypothetical protein
VPELQSLRSLNTSIELGAGITKAKAKESVPDMG